MTRRLIVDTDTAGDDTQALLLSVLSDRCTVEAVTICAGNVPFDDQVENAKYTLSLADAADVPVYEGAREPLLKSFEHAEYVHGEGGLGGDLRPDTGIPSADGFAPDAIVELARERPGERSLLCIAPLTNVALALAREPDLGDLLDEVYVMGGALNWAGNVTPAAEYNFWVDPDAARRVLRDLDVTLVDWGLCMRAGVFGPAEFERFEALDTRYADFFHEITTTVRAFTRERQGVDGVTQPDSLTAACMLYPDVVEAATTCHVDVDERAGMTRGYSLMDDADLLDAEKRTTVVEQVDEAAFRELFAAMLAGDPDAAAPRA